MMKIKDGSNWYIADLNNYTDSFLRLIILDLHEKLEEQEKLKGDE